MMEQLVPMAKEFVTTQASYYRAMPAGKLAELMRTMDRSSGHSGS